MGNEPCKIQLLLSLFFSLLLFYLRLGVCVQFVLRQFIFEDEPHTSRYVFFFYTSDDHVRPPEAFFAKKFRRKIPTKHRVRRADQGAASVLFAPLFRNVFRFPSTKSSYVPSFKPLSRTSDKRSSSASADSISPFSFVMRRFISRRVPPPSWAPIYLTENRRNVQCGVGDVGEIYLWGQRRTGRLIACTECPYVIIIIIVYRMRVREFQFDVVWSANYAFRANRPRKKKKLTHQLCVDTTFEWRIVWLLYERVVTAL